jgi:hypothetical protein
VELIQLSQGLLGTKVYAKPGHMIADETTWYETGATNREQHVSSSISEARNNAEARKQVEYKDWSSRMDGIPISPDQLGRGLNAEQSTFKLDSSSALVTQPSYLYPYSPHPRKALMIIRGVTSSQRIACAYQM